jgi:hypothetical protein
LSLSGPSKRGGITVRRSGKPAWEVCFREEVFSLEICDAVENEWQARKPIARDLVYKADAS